MTNQARKAFLRKGSPFNQSNCSYLHIWKLLHAAQPTIEVALRLQLVSLAQSRPGSSSLEASEACLFFYGGYLSATIVQLCAHIEACNRIDPCRHSLRLLRYESINGFTLAELLGEGIPPHAILSHTWGEHELSIASPTRDTTTSNDKLRFCTQQAVHDGLWYFWIDNCCIDRAKPAQVSAANNSRSG